MMKTEQSSDLWNRGTADCRLWHQSLKTGIRLKVELYKAKNSFQGNHKKARYRSRENIKNSQEDTDSTEMLLWSLNLQGICQNHIFLKRRYLVEQYLRIYFPAVEKGLQECVKAGPLAGYPVVGVKAYFDRWFLSSGGFFRNGI